MIFRSVRFRLLVWNIGVLALVLSAFLVLAHVTVRTYLLTSVDRRLHGMADRLAEFAFRPELRPPPPPSGARPSRRFEFNGRRRFQELRLYNSQGQQLGPDGMVEDAPGTPWDLTALRRVRDGGVITSIVTHDEERLRVYTRPVVREGKRLGVIQVSSNFSEAEAMLDGLTRLQLILMPIALLVAAFGGFFLTDRALQPVRRITEAAEQLDSTDLSQRLPATGADEFAHLATTMNGMLARIQASFDRLRESFERERRFTADASHELRTPLTGLKANTSLALRGERTPAQYREALQAADQAADRMTRLVGDLLLLARSDSGQLSLQPEPVDPEDICREAVALTARAPGHAAVRLQVAADAGCIAGDREHLVRLVANLVENALRYTPETGTVTLTATRHGDRVRLVVADTGEGIAPEHLPHLGERFYRVDPDRARPHGGAGLGLAISRSIVDIHAGALHIDSTPGEGTTVTVELPAME